MPSISACTPDQQKRIRELSKAIDTFEEAKSTQLLAEAQGKAPAILFKDFYRNVTGLDFDLDTKPDLKTINKLNRRIKQLDKKWVKPNKFKEFFYLPEVIMSKNPITKRVYDGFVKAGNFYRGNTERFSNNLGHIVRNIDIAIKEKDVSAKWGSTARNAASRLRLLEKKYQLLLKEKKFSEADQFYDDFLADLGSSKDVQLKTLDDAYTLFSDPSKITQKDKYGTALVEAASVWHGSKGKEGMKDKLWNILKSGLDDYAAVIRLSKKDDWGFEGTERAIAKLLDDFKPQDNYFPTQVLDIFPVISKLNEGIFNNTSIDGKRAFDPAEAKQHIDNMIKEISSNLKKPGNVYAQSAVSVNRHSKNVIDIIDTYTKNVVKFNYMARMTRRTAEGLKSLGGMYGNDFDNHLDFMKNYLKDTHATATGINSGNSALKSFSRAATSWGYLSKLGLNVRGAARNATQSLQNYIWFGRKGISDSLTYIKAENLEDQLTEAMKQEGVFFVNIGELAGDNKLFSEVILKDGKPTFENDSFMDRFNEKMESVAQKVSDVPVIGMQSVENWNRQLTFKIAFAQEYKRLMSNDALVKDALRKSGKITDDTKASEVASQVRKRVAKKAQRFASNMTNELHYDYSRYAKSKAVRGPIGSVLGQFTTYSMNFMNYQVKIAKAAGNSAIEGSWNSPEMQRAIRLGMTYMIIGAIIEPLTNTTITNLVQNDTYDRIENLHTWLSGDEDERKKAFFGKGPLLGTFGGPFIGDLINIGNLAGFVNMDEGSFLSYLGAHENLPDNVKDEKMKEFIRILNPQVHRTFYNTIPRMINGMTLGTAASQELALYKDPEASKIKRKFANSAALRMMPDPMRDYLTPKDVKDERESKRSDFWAYGSQQDDNGNLNDLFRMLQERQD
jgi:hypothetical protein